MMRKALVLDANILIRAVLGTKVRGILEEYNELADFFTPIQCIDDARKHLPAILGRRDFPIEPDFEVLAWVINPLHPLDDGWLRAFEKIARSRLRRDENDWPILAAALALNCPIWTEDPDFFGVGAATWTTATVRHYLDE
jgi:predicted nucleic acid-binding protein